jgi:hypothetical protein
VNKRFKKLMKWLGLFSVLCAGGAVPIVAMFMFLPMAQIIRETHGLIGLGLGMAFCLGAVIAAVCWWLATGRSLMDSLVFGDGL